MYEINETHDPNLRSWVESANDPNNDFPIQNLPFCIFYDDVKKHKEIHIGVLIGDQVLNVDFCFEDGLLDGSYHEVLGSRRMWSCLDGLMDFTIDERTGLRKRISEILTEGF